MKPLLPAKPKLTAIASKAKTALQKKPPAANAAIAQAVRAQTQKTLETIEQSPLGRSPVGAAFREMLQDRLASDSGVDDLLQELRKRAEKELDARRHIVNGLSDLLAQCRDRDKSRRFRDEVIQPVRSRTINGPQAWDRVTAIMATPFPFLTWVERRLGPVTVGMAIQAEAGAGAGVGVAVGLAGMRHGMGCYFRQLSVSVGAVAEVDFGVQLSVAQGKPEQGLSYGVEVGVGGGYNATAGVTVAFTPSIEGPPSLKTKSPMIEYEYSGIAVSLGGGGGLDIGVALGVTESILLSGLLP